MRGLDARGLGRASRGGRETQAPRPAPCGSLASPRLQLIIYNDLEDDEVSRTFQAEQFAILIIPSHGCWALVQPCQPLLVPCAREPDKIFV